MVGEGGSSPVAISLWTSEHCWTGQCVRWGSWHLRVGGGTGYRLEGKQSGRHIQAALGDVRMMEVFTLSVGRDIQQRWAQGGPAICRDPLEGEGKGKKEEVPQPGSAGILRGHLIAH